MQARRECLRGCRAAATFAHAPAIAIAGIAAIFQPQRGRRGIRRVLAVAQHEAQAIAAVRRHLQPAQGLRGAAWTTCSTPRSIPAACQAGA